MKKNNWIPLLFVSFFSFSQTVIETDSIKTKSFHFSVDLFSRYLWRGQCWGGNYLVIQPTIKYDFSKKITAGVWATSNFQKDYFYPEGTSYKGYQEIDFFVMYKMNKYLTLQLWDYYWPTVTTVTDIDNDFFNYQHNGVKTIDFIASFDFSDLGFPFNATISTLIAGNDFRYDEDGNNPTQNFTTYIEAGYKFKNIFKKGHSKIVNNIEVAPSIGIVLNNQALYYAAGDNDKPSFVNLSGKLSREFELGPNWTLPVSLTYVHNGATKNTEIFGRNFLIFGLNITH